MSRRTNDAFTIPELLVATAITALIVVMLGTMFGSLANTTARSNQRIDTFRDARAALQIMARDFSHLVKAQPAAYFVIQSDAAGPDVRQLDGLISLKNTPATGSDVSGDVCAVRYYCSWNNNAYSLRRYFRDSSQTFQTFQSNLTTGSPPALNYVNTTALYLGANPIDETLASYVWNLQVVAYDSLGNIINQQNDAFSRSTSGPYTCDPLGSTNVLPAAIEISFNAMSPEAARTVMATTSGRADAYNVWMVADNPNASATDKQLYQRMILPNLYNFRTRIVFQ